MAGFNIRQQENEIFQAMGNLFLRSVREFEEYISRALPPAKKPDKEKEKDALAENISEWLFDFSERPEGIQRKNYGQKSSERSWSFFPFKAVFKNEL
jgi:hypothetical protein